MTQDPAVPSISEAQPPSKLQEFIQQLQEQVAELARDLHAAIALQQDGRLDDAETIYRKLLASVPNHPFALRFLGVIAAQRGQPEQGVELIGRAFPALARLPDAHVDYGNVLHAAGRDEQAVASYRQALALKPDFAQAHTCLANVLCGVGRFEASISHCEAAIAVEPNALRPRFVLVAALKGAGRMPEVAAAWRQIIEIDPRRADSYHQLAVELSQLRLYAEAVHCHERAIALRANDLDFLWARGQTLMHMNEGEKAVDAFRQIIAVSPDHTQALAGLGWALRFLGRYDEADACVRRLRELDPGNMLAVSHLSSSRRGDNEPEADAGHLTSVLNAPESRSGDRITAEFTLGRLLDDEGRFDDAFEHYALANRLVRENWPSNGDSYDTERFRSWIDRAITNATPEWFADDSESGHISELPVFVVGMPRSGTTLVEQICASHSLVFGAGELGAIPRIRLASRQSGLAPEETAAAYRQAAAKHLLELRHMGNGAVRVIDKLPDNILHVGLIARLFPRARVIWCSRDGRDTALSCYFQSLVQGAQYFSYDLADCGTRHRQIERLARHLLTLRPYHMIEVNYERLVSDLETESRRLIAFLGLDWDPACLNFHRTERSVSTVSHWQVRQPLYGSSIGRWRHYERHLMPLFEALGWPPAEGC